MAKRSNVKNRKNVKHNLVVVEWLDHFSTSAWMTREDVKSVVDHDLTNITIAFIVYEDERRLAIAQTVGTDDDRLCDVMTIYKNHIVRRLKWAAPDFRR